MNDNRPGNSSVHPFYCRNSDGNSDVKEFEAKIESVQMARIDIRLT